MLCAGRLNIRVNNNQVQSRVASSGQWHKAKVCNDNLVRPLTPFFHLARKKSGIKFIIILMLLNLFSLLLLVVSKQNCSINV